jgi:hypothetical protein
MTFLPLVREASYRGGHRIHLVFNDGRAGTVNFRRWLGGGVFEPLVDLDHFRRFFIDGGTVAWPNGVDIAPETLYAATPSSPRSNKRLQPTKARRASRKTSSRSSRLRS